MEIVLPLRVYLSFVTSVLFCSSFKELVDALDPLTRRRSWSATSVMEYTQKNYQFEKLIPLKQLMDESYALSNSLAGYSPAERLDSINAFVRTRCSVFPSDVVVNFDLNEVY